MIFVPGAKYPVYDNQGNLIGVRQGHVIAYYNGTLRGTPYSNLYVSPNGYNLYYDDNGGVSSIPGINPKTAKPYQKVVHVYSVEQAFVFGKALTFRQKAIEAMQAAQKEGNQQAYQQAKQIEQQNEQIMSAVVNLKNPADAGNGQLMHQLGHSVAGYKEFGGDQTSDRVAASWMSEAMMAKGCSDPKAHDAYVKSMGYHMVEAAPRDRKWGAGVDIAQTSDLESYTGENFQGSLLTSVRNQLIGDELYRQHVKEEFNKKLAAASAQLSLDGQSVAPSQPHQSQPQSKPTIYYAAVINGKGAIFNSRQDFLDATQNVDGVDMHRFKTKRYAEEWAGMPFADLRHQYVDRLMQLYKDQGTQPRNDRPQTIQPAATNQGYAPNMEPTQNLQGQTTGQPTQPAPTNSGQQTTNQDYAPNMGGSQSNLAVSQGYDPKMGQNQNSQGQTTQPVNDEQNYAPNMGSNSGSTTQPQNTQPAPQPTVPQPTQSTAPAPANDDAPRSPQDMPQTVYPQGQAVSNQPDSNYTVTAFGHEPREIYQLLHYADQAQWANTEQGKQGQKMPNDSSKNLGSQINYSNEDSGRNVSDRYALAEQMKFEALIKQRIDEYGPVEVQCSFGPGAEMAFTRAAIAIKRDKSPEGRKYAKALSVIGNFTGPEEFVERNNRDFRKPEHKNGPTYAETSAEEAKLLMNEMDKVNRYQVVTDKNGQKMVTAQQWDKKQVREYLSGSPSGFNADFQKAQQQYDNQLAQLKAKYPKKKYFHVSLVPLPLKWQMNHDMIDRSHELAAVYSGNPVNSFDKYHKDEQLYDVAKLISYAEDDPKNYDYRNVKKPDPIDSQTGMIFSQRTVGKDKDGNPMRMQITPVDVIDVGNLARDLRNKGRNEAWHDQVVDGQSVNASLETDPIPKVHQDKNGRHYVTYEPSHYRESVLEGFKTPYYDGKFNTYGPSPDSYQPTNNDGPQDNGNNQPLQNNGGGYTPNMNGGNNQPAGDNGDNQPTSPKKNNKPEDDGPSDQDLADFNSGNLHAPTSDHLDPSQPVKPTNTPGDYQVENAAKKVKASGKVKSDSAKKNLKKQVDDQKKKNQQKRNNDAGVKPHQSMPKAPSVNDDSVFGDD